MVINAISIDDEEINLIMLDEIAKTSGIELVSFVEPLKAFEYIKSNPVDLAFVDYLMPDIDGIEMTRLIRDFNPDSPIIMLTSLGDNREVKLKAIEAGATEFLSKPIDASEFIARTKNLISLREAQLLLMDRAKLLEEEVRKATEKIAQREFETLSVLGRAADYKDHKTANHVLRVAHISKLIAGAAGIDEGEQNLIFHASPLHDVGKFGIPDSILGKQGKLTDEEFEIMKNHTVMGYNILRNSSSEFLQTGSLIAISHHEKFSGGGYPNSLKGEDIPLFGRIVALADAFDAMLSRRPYKEPWSVEKVIEIIVNEKGKHFDPVIVEAFLGVIDEVLKIYEQFED